MNHRIERVLDIFSDISKVPRNSGNREPMKDWLVQWAEERNLEYSVDGEMNVVIRVPGSPGREEEPSIAVQAHTDMVCAVENGVEHDFSSDPIRLIRDGDWLTADGTSLGADNGIGLAMALACAEDSDLSRPPLEVIATTDEELGLLGAAAMDISMIRSRRMINLDGGPENSLVVGCAGGIGRKMLIPAEFVSAPERAARRLTVTGFLGGHSGADVTRGRGSAIMELARGLLRIHDECPFSLASFDGGEAHNAIPRDASAVVIPHSVPDEELEKAWTAFRDILRSEYGEDEPGVDCRMEPVPVPESVMTEESGLRILRFLISVPDGLLARSRRDFSIPETSSNLGIAATSPEGLRCRLMIRSILDTRARAVDRRMEAAIELAGGSTEYRNDIAAWQPVSESVLQSAVLRLMDGGQLGFMHGVVECGVLANRIPGLDAVCFGPDIEHMHSPDERVNLPSSGRIYERLRKLLANPG